MKYNNSINGSQRWKAKIGDINENGEERKEKKYKR